MLTKIPKTTSIPTKVNPINIPLLPFRLGNARITESRHTFLHYIETNPLINNLNNIEYSYDIINKLINQTLENALPNPHYITATSLLNHAKYLIIEANTKLNNIKPHTRTKRGLINIIGKASKWLFGTLDSDDAEKYDKAIIELQHHENSYKKEIDLQASLTKQLIENYNGTITLLNKNQLLIKDHITTYERSLNTTIADLTIFLRTQNTLFQIILNCQSLITFLDNLEDAIMFAKLNTLHTTIISALELERVISNLTGLYGNNKILTFTDLKYYYQLAGLQVNFSKDKIIFAIHFPIFTSDSFEIFHLIPVPVNNTIFIPKLSHLIIGTDLQQYEEDACPMVQDIYICQNHLSPQFDDCAVALIKKAEVQNCEIIKVNVSTPIVQPITSEYALAIPSKDDLKMQKSCENNEIAILKGPSLISIPMNCGIIINNIQIWNKEEIIKGSPFLLPLIRTDNITPPVMNQETLKLNSINLDQIKNLQQQAKHLASPEPMDNYPVTWSLATNYIILFIIVGTIIVALWKVYKRRVNKNVRTNEAVPGDPSENNPSSLLFSTSAGGAM